MPLRHTFPIREQDEAIEPEDRRRNTWTLVFGQHLGINERKESRAADLGQRKKSGGGKGLTI
jgi:hypothetical protein